MWSVKNYRIHLVNPAVFIDTLDREASNCVVKNNSSCTGTLLNRNANLFTYNITGKKRERERFITVQKKYF